MRDIIFTFFNYFVFFYTSMLAIFFVTFAFLSFISLKRRKDYYVESYMRKTIKESPYTPGISVIAPAFNEEKTIIDNVNSMLALEYPLFEIFRKLPQNSPHLKAVLLWKYIPTNRVYRFTQETSSTEP